MFFVLKECIHSMVHVSIQHKVHSLNLSLCYSCGVEKREKAETSQDILLIAGLLAIQT